MTPSADPLGKPRPIFVAGRWNRRSAEKCLVHDEPHPASSFYPARSFTALLNPPITLSLTSIVAFELLVP